MANTVRLRIFLSHASEDSGLAERVSIALLQDGHEVFFDRSKLQAGAAYHRAIRDEIDRSDLFLFLVSRAALARGRYTLTELRLARERWPDPAGRVLPVLVPRTGQAKIPSYLTAVGVFRPEGDTAAEVAAQVERLIDKGLVAAIEPRGEGAKGILDEAFRDSRVESVKSELNLVHMQARGQATLLRSEVFPILRGLFVGRNTFIEPIRDCRDEMWTERFVAAAETRRLIDAYRPVVVKHAKPGDEGLVQSYEGLNLHSYLQELTGLFDPRPGVNEITERLRGGEVEAVREGLNLAEIHPKEKIAPKVIKACDAKQRSIRRVWMGWPVI